MILILADDLHKLAAPRTGSIGTVPFPIEVEVDESQPENHFEIEVLGSKDLGALYVEDGKEVRAIRHDFRFKASTETWQNLHDCLSRKASKKASEDTDDDVVHAYFEKEGFTYTKLESVAAATNGFATTVPGPVQAG